MYSIIIVDDEDITRVAIKTFIHKKHPQFEIVGMFSNGADAFAYLREHSVSVVITDIRMPKMDGLELSRLIYENFPGISVIIISGYSEFEYARKAIHYGVANYLLKPLDFQELSQNLTNAQQKLDSLSLETDYDEEEIQLFFTDLIGGMISDNKELEQRFAQLNLQGKSDNYKGCFMTITLTKNDALSRWQYGQEKLANALLNGLRMLLPKYYVYYLFRSGMRFYCVVLSTQNIPSISVEELSRELFQLIHFNSSIQIHSIFNHITDLKDQNSNFIKADAGLKQVTPNQDIVIQKAMEYIQAHYSEDLTRESVADAVFLSSAYFSRFFKQKTGLSFIDYLTTVRMQKAIELLGTRMKVEDIAKKVGYQSRNRFFINFRQYSGYNPTEYRKQILQMEDYFKEQDGE